jgi:hypothetical protein
MSHRKYINFISVDCGDEAYSMIPTPEMQYELRYGYRVQDIALSAAAVVDTFAHLITECTQKEQLRRLKLMREALMESRPA